MNLLYKIFIQSKLYTTKYTIDQVESVLNNPKVTLDFKINIKKISTNQYRIQPNVSFGVNTLKGFSSHISVILKIEEVQNKVQIKLFTKPRLELIMFFLVGFFVIFSTLILATELIPRIIIPIIIILSFLWFRMIYRMQEVSLFEKTERFLKLRQKN